jgi:hypothetical protein
MKLPFKLFRKARPSEPPPAARIELRRSHPRTPVQRRDAVYPPSAPPPAQEVRPADRPDGPDTRIEGASPRPPVRPPSPRATGADAKPRSVRGYGRRQPPPPPEKPVRRDPKRRLKSEAELRREMPTPMQYDDPT